MALEQVRVGDVSVLTYEGFARVLIYWLVALRTFTLARILYER